MEKTRKKGAQRKKRKGNFSGEPKKKKESSKTKKKIEEIAELFLPTSIFLDRSVSVLEAISEHLKDKENLSYHEIAVLLNRDDRTIWTCYHRAKKKRDTL